MVIGFFVGAFFRKSINPTREKQKKNQNEFVMQKIESQMRFLLIIYIV